MPDSLSLTTRRLTASNTLAPTSNPGNCPTNSAVQLSVGNTGANTDCARPLTAGTTVTDTRADKELATRTTTEPASGRG